MTVIAPSCGELLSFTKIGVSKTFMLSTSGSFPERLFGKIGMLDIFLSEAK